MNPRPPDCESILDPKPINLSIADTNFDYADFKSWLEKRYSKRYASSIQYYNKRYRHLFNGALTEIESFSKAKKRMVLVSLIALSKYLGVYEAFRQKMRNFGVKWGRRNNLDSFRRIWNNDAADISEWLAQCIDRLDRAYSTFMKFCSISGLRKGEAINAFNLILKLNSQGNLEEYYNSKLETLEHYRFPEIFLRRNKNVFFSFIPKTFLKAEILKHGQRISNTSLRRRFHDCHLKCRLQDLRHYHATYLIKHGLIQQEADLLQGRINESIFMQHYFSPSIEELRTRTLSAIRQMMPKL